MATESCDRRFSWPFEIDLYKQKLINERLILFLSVLKFRPAVTGLKVVSHGLQVKEKHSQVPGYQGECNENVE